MKQVLIKKGAAHTVEVPIPQMAQGEVLVRVQVSCLSIGTELSGLRGSGIPIWKKALAQPEKVKATLKMVTKQGVRKTLGIIEEKTEAAHLTGYSAAGIVVAVGSDVTDIAVNDRVACAGAQYAYHAEYISVARNLCTVIPEDVDFESASTVTLGAIALQGVRRAKPTIGETFVVIGLGILGQITVQILRANGCRVVGIDTDQARIDFATSLGMEHGQLAESSDIESVFRFSDGHGADGVIIAAATPSDSVVSTAFKMCRKKGRVILVGDVGLSLSRADFYVKEIDFLISTSYGPGRYDRHYEEEGLDYPIGYVRWTENRNMAEFLRLIATGRVQVAPMIALRFPIEEAAAAYDAIGGSEKPLLAILTYESNKGEGYPIRKMNISASPRLEQSKIRIALIGAGEFARLTHLPNLKQLKNEYHLRAVVNRSGPSVKAVGSQYGVDYVSTDPNDVFDDPEIDAVLIATRHHLHGPLALAALNAGKHVLVEKPLTLSENEITEFKTFFEGEAEGTGRTDKPILLTGYNRRFSTYARRMKELVVNRSTPFMLNYRMNAGYIPQDHWVHTLEGGGRNIGEACHIYDLFTYLTDSETNVISAQAIKPGTGYYSRNDNFVATISFKDGSLATLTYTALGHSKFPKEYAELYVDGRVVVMDDYHSLKLYGSSNASYTTRLQDKGLLSELDSFAKGIRSGEWPIPLWHQFQVSEIAFEVENQIRLK